VKLLVATRSTGKQPEMRRALEAAGHEILFPDQAGIAATAAEGTLETAETFEANARRKAEYFARLGGLPTVADDSGLEVYSLGGAPGVRSRRWAGATGPADAVDRANNAELLRRLAGAPPERRRARYRCVLVFMPQAGGIPESFEGACSGTILTEPRGTGGFGYDPLFMSDDLGRTFGEAPAEDKERVSHRGRALAALVSRLAHPGNRS
jgi:XTP/dITP diphosphohydrolase